MAIRDRSGRQLGNPRSDNYRRILDTGMEALVGGLFGFPDVQRQVMESEVKTRDNIFKHALGTIRQEQSIKAQTEAYKDREKWKHGENERRKDEPLAELVAKSLRNKHARISKTAFHLGYSELVPNLPEGPITHRWLANFNMNMNGLIEQGIHIDPTNARKIRREIDKASAQWVSSFFLKSHVTQQEVFPAGHFSRKEIPPPNLIKEQVAGQSVISRKVAEALRAESKHGLTELQAYQLDKYDESKRSKSVETPRDDRTSMGMIDKTDRRVTSKTKADVLGLKIKDLKIIQLAFSYEEANSQRKGLGKFLYPNYDPNSKKSARVEKALVEFGISPTPGKTKDKDFEKSKIKKAAADAKRPFNELDDEESRGLVFREETGVQPSLLKQGKRRGKPFTPEEIVGSILNRKGNFIYTLDGNPVSDQQAFRSRVGKAKGQLRRYKNKNEMGTLTQTDIDKEKKLQAFLQQVDRVPASTIRGARTERTLTVPPVKKIIDEEFSEYGDYFTNEDIISIQGVWGHAKRNIENIIDRNKWDRLGLPERMKGRLGKNLATSIENAESKIKDILKRLKFIAEKENKKKISKEDEIKIKNLTVRQPYKQVLDLMSLFFSETTPITRRQLLKTDMGKLLDSLGENLNRDRIAFIKNMNKGRFRDDLTTSSKDIYKQAMESGKTRSRESLTQVEKEENEKIERGLNQTWESTIDKLLLLLKGKQKNKSIKDFNHIWQLMNKQGFSPDKVGITNTGAFMMGEAS